MSSFMRTFKFYMGTVAFGSLLIAIMQVREGREGDRRCCCCCGQGDHRCCCCRCCCSCVEGSRSHTGRLPCALHKSNKPVPSLPLTSTSRAPCLPLMLISLSLPPVSLSLSLPPPQFIRVIVAYVYKRMKDNGSANNTWVKFICCCLQVRSW